MNDDQKLGLFCPKASSAYELFQISWEGEECTLINEHTPGYEGPDMSPSPVGDAAGKGNA